jgi:hypothetical protein
MLNSADVASPQTICIKIRFLLMKPSAFLVETGEASYHIINIFRGALSCVCLAGRGERIPVSKDSYLPLPTWKWRILDVSVIFETAREDTVGSS